MINGKVPDYVLMFMGAAILGLIVRWTSQKEGNQEGLNTAANNENKAGNTMLYWIFAMLIAFSPVIGILLAGLFDSFRNGAHSVGVVIACSAFPIAISLPLSLGLARMSGQARYANYWQHLENVMRIGKKHILLQWGIVTLAVTLVGAFLIFS